MTINAAPITEEHEFDEELDYEEELDYMDMFALTFKNVRLDLVEGYAAQHQHKIDKIKYKLENSFFLMFLDGNESPNYEQCYEVMEDLLGSMGDQFEYMKYVDADYQVVCHCTTDTEDIPDDCKKRLFADKGEKPFIISLDKQNLYN